MGFTFGVILWESCETVLVVEAEVGKRGTEELLRRLRKFGVILQS